MCAHPTHPSAEARLRAADGRGRLLFVGGLFCDMVFADAELPEPGGETFAAHFAFSPGGVANRAVAAARLGVPTSLVSVAGDDPLGALALQALRDEEGLDTSGVAVLPGRQTAITVSLSGEHDRSFITYEEPEVAVTPDDGSYAAAHLSVAGELPGWAGALRNSGTTLVGGVGWDASEMWSSDVLRRLSDVDVFVPNEIEAMRYTGAQDALTAARGLAEYVPLAIVTRGRKGAVAADSASGRLVEVPGIEVPAVDPTGAGDVFVGSFMASALHEWDLETRLRFACLCAASSVTRVGGSISAPRPDDLRRLIEHRHLDGDWSFLSSLSE